MKSPKPKLLLLAFLLGSNLWAQEITQYNYGFEKFTLPADHSNSLVSKVPQNLLLNKDQLYIVPDGTGRVYRVDYKNSLQIERIDSTIYFGFTFGSQIFFYKDTLYSFGGYGYWHTNGQLRVFVPQKKEWEIEPISEEVSFSKSSSTPLLWLDEKDGNLWVSKSNRRKEGIKNGKEFRNSSDSIFVLSLKSKDFIKVGILKAEISELIRSSSTKYLGGSPWGQLIYSSEQGTVYLLDFKKNQQLTLDEGKAKEMIRIIPASGLLHFRDSTMIIQSSNNWLTGNFQHADSVKLSRSDFLFKNQVYEDVQVPVLSDAKSFYTNAVLGFFVGCLLTGLVFHFGIRPRQTNKRISEILSIEFDEREKEVIRSVSINSTKGIGTTVEQINQILGVSNKTIEIQKKQRSDLFISINEKWNRVNKEVLIDKRRVDHDKRSFEYLISPSQLDKISSWILVENKIRS